MPVCSRATRSKMEMSGAAGFFLYFAFGSNLLKERLQLANPSATFYKTGRLKVCTIKTALLLLYLVFIIASVNHLLAMMCYRVRDI